jgi:hypothetical protein
MRRSKRTEITIETHERLVVRAREKLAEPPFYCPVCADYSRAVVPEDAAALAGVNIRTIFRWVESGLVHFTETDEGRLLLCVQSLHS